jgi:hypothetical protein
MSPATSKDHMPHLKKTAFIHVTRNTKKSFYSCHAPHLKDELLFMSGATFKKELLFMSAAILKRAFTMSPPPPHIKKELS